MQILRATNLPEQAAAYYVRIHGMARQHQITLQQEFDEHDTPDTQYIVIMDDYLPVATCRIYPIDATRIMLGRLVVLPDYRHRGLGTQVVAEAEAWAREQGFRTCILESRQEKVTFYQRLGYKADPLRVTEGTFRCIYMEKEISLARSE